MIVAMVPYPRRHYTVIYELLEAGEEQFSFGKKGIACMQAVQSMANRNIVREEYSRSVELGMEMDLTV